MTEIDLCICTFRRAHIRDTLLSVAALDLTGIALRVIVADNDDTPSAKILVEDTAREAGLKLVYLHAPARNISIARNACLDAATAPLIAFIDDDELVTKEWLLQLLEPMQDGIDVVLGPVEAIYPPDDMRQQDEDFHSTRPVVAGGKIITGYTCNVLFRRAVPVFDGLRFRPELGRTGGEDTAFFAAAHAKGARITYAPDAIVTEKVTKERAKFSWLVKRRFRAGQSHGWLILEESRGARFPNIIKAAAKAAFCFAAALAHIARPPAMKSWVLRGMLHVGVVSRLLGKATIEQYG